MPVAARTLGTSRPGVAPHDGTCLHPKRAGIAFPRRQDVTSKDPAVRESDQYSTR